ncbi:MAG: membrane protein insertion efficiency factor YidD [Candidatus Omnitrophota bacterium]
MIRLLNIALKFYKSSISPFLGTNCRFYPSCSEYFITAIKKYGILKGALVGTRRILRCNNFFNGGYDPI